MAAAGALVGVAAAAVGSAAALVAAGAFVALGSAAALVGAGALVGFGASGADVGAAGALVAATPSGALVASGAAVGVLEEVSAPHAASRAQKARASKERWYSMRITFLCSFHAPGARADSVGLSTNVPS